MTSNNDITNDKFCILPWIHLNLWPSGDVHACCLGDWQKPIGNVRDNTLIEIANGDALKLMRKQMLEGIAPSACERCFERERLNIPSLRQSKNKIFSHRIEESISNTNEDFSLKEVKLRYWDFRFSNLCNMKCRMCGSGFSSLWYDDEVAMGIPHVNKRVVNANDFSKQDLLDFVNQNINDVEFIYFAGGEPLIMDEHYYILEKLIELGKTDVTLRYNTNGLKLKFKNYNLVDLWSKFNNVHVLCSVDSYGARAEYIRNGTRWPVLKNNIKELVAMENIALSIEITTGLFNIYTLPELFDELISIGVDINQIQTHNILQTPLYYHSAILTDIDKTAIKNKLSQYINKFDDWHQQVLNQKFAGIIDNMYTPIDNLEYWRNTFIDKTAMLDDLRNENFLDTFPELHDFYNFITP